MNSNGPGRDTSRSHTSIIEPARLAEGLWCTKFQSSPSSIYFRSRPRSCQMSANAFFNPNPNPNPPIQMSQTLYIMHKGDGFSAKPLGKSILHCQNVWSGATVIISIYLLISAYFVTLHTGTPNCPH